MRTEMARFLAATAVPSRLSLHPRAPGICPREPRAAYLYILRMEEPGRFTTLRWFGSGGLVWTVFPLVLNVCALHAPSFLPCDYRKFSPRTTGFFELLRRFHINRSVTRAG